MPVYFSCFYINFSVFKKNFFCDFFKKICSKKKKKNLPHRMNYGTSPIPTLEWLIILLFSTTFFLKSDVDQWLKN